jgi:hypothetical protein
MIPILEDTEDGAATAGHRRRIRAQTPQPVFNARQFRIASEDYLLEVINARRINSHRAGVESSARRLPPNLLLETNKFIL